MTSSRRGPKGPASRDACASRRCRASTSGARRRSREATAPSRAPEETGYAAAWCDDWNGDFGVYKVFRRRGDCLDYLVDMVFERAELLGVEVVDQGAVPVVRDGRTAFPLMTREQVRDHLGGGYDYGIVLETDCMMNVTAQATVGVREVDIG